LAASPLRRDESETIILCAAPFYLKRFHLLNLYYLRTEGLPPIQRTDVRGVAAKTGVGAIVRLFLPGVTVLMTVSCDAEWISVTAVTIYQ
jgi:hypothetical protein